MKAIIMLVSLLGIAGVLFLFYNKVSIAETYFRLDRSPIWCDALFCFFGCHLAVTRGIALIGKIF